MKKLIWLVYDGMAHSVFAGQVLAPAVDFCKKDPDLKVTIITFEKHAPSQDLIKNYSSMHPHLSIRVMRRLSFLGVLSLFPALYQLRRFVKKLDEYEIKARGPLAGWLALHGKNSKCAQLTVQARGLLAEEYWYRHGKETNFLKRIFHIWRHMELEVIEQEVYESGIAVEAVTPAMKQYLINTFNAASENIYIAQDDIPPTFKPAQVGQWKNSVRQELKISDEAHVYCFIGSVKAWQKPDMVIEYFLQQLKKNPESVLLVLTQDVVEFTQKCIDSHVPLGQIRILSVAHEDIYRYLSAANTGLIFRDSHTLSFVARPVKAMEYQSVGLEIVHNETVDWLNHHAPQAVDGSQADQS